MLFSGQELRTWQLRALDQWLPNRRGTLEVVTGAGKTTFALEAYASVTKTQPKLRLVVLVPTEALADQWFAAAAADLGLDQSEIVVFSGQHDRRPPGRVSIAVVNTARTLAGLLAGEGDAMLVVDECHRFGSKENASALSGEWSATLGLSATPERSFDDGFGSNVAPRIGEVIFRYGYAEARRDGVIVPFALHNVRVASEAVENRSAMRNKRERFLATARSRLPATVLLLTSLSPERKAVVFDESIPRATTLARLLQARNVSCALYHSRLAPAHRRDNLRLFRAGMLRVLVTCRALDEGANIPEASCGVIMSSTSSVRQRIQRIGRVLRPAPGKTHSDLYTLYSTAEAENRLIAEAVNLEGVASIDWLAAETMKRVEAPPR